MEAAVDLEKLFTLYRDGFGTRAISEQVKVPRTTVRRLLQRAGIYQGANRPSPSRFSPLLEKLSPEARPGDASTAAVHSGAPLNITTAPSPPVVEAQPAHGDTANIPPPVEILPEIIEPEVIDLHGSPMDPSTWAAREASVRPDGKGWIVELHGLNAALLCPLPNTCVGRVIRWSAKFTLINPAVGSCELAIADAAGVDSISVGLQRPYMLTTGGEHWHAVRHICAQHPRLWIKGNQHNSQVVRISSIASNLR
jgi:hypothetical protein